MFERTVLGLDVGSYSVKAAQLRAGLRGVEFMRFEEGRLPLDGGREEQSAAVAEFLADRGLPTEFVVAALPSQDGTQRHVSFPFDEARRVARALPFEVEEDLPIPLAEFVVAHERRIAAPGLAEVLAVLAPRAAVAARLEMLRAARAEPRILEAEGAVLANLSGFLRLGEAPRVLVDVGHRKTTLCLLKGGKPTMRRCIPIGGVHLTDALARDLGLGHAEAEARKHESGVFERTTGAAVTPSVSEVLERLARELLRTLQSFEIDPQPPAEPSEVLLVGGSALVPLLPDFLSERLGRSCRLLRVPPGEGGRSLYSSVGPERFAHAAALALRGAPAARITRLDLRKEEFRYTPDLSDLRRGLRPAAALAALAVALWITSLGIRLVDYGRQAHALRSQLIAIHRQAFPDAPAPEDPLADIETRVRETRELASHLGVTGNGLSPLEVLARVGERIPENAETGLIELEIERYSVQARGFAPSFEAVDQIRAELSQTEAFENVRLSDVVTDPKRGGKTFSLSIRLPEGA
jgi:type IV pilus assembly protein PilM